MRLEAAIDQAAASTVVVREVRAQTRYASVAAIRALEKRLVQALEGDRLRGVPNLGRRNGKPLRALRLGTKRTTEVRGLGHEHEVLALSNQGRLVMVRLVGQEPEQRAAFDDELVIEDLEGFCRVVREALERHLSLTGQRVDALHRMGRLATKLGEVLDQA